MLQALLKDIKPFLLMFFISILLAVGDAVGIASPLKSTVGWVTIPIQYGLYKTSLGVGRQFEFVALSRRASQENKALTEQLASALSENANLRRKLAEAEGFLEQQKTLDPIEFNLVAARPVGVSRYLLIDKGGNEGIKQNQAVIYKDNFIGLVTEVSDKKSKVLLSSDPDAKIAVFTSGSDGKAKGILQGQFGSDLLLDKILHQEPIKAGDLVYTEGSDLQIPRGLIAGQVLEVMGRDNEVFKQAKVKPVFDVTNLDIVFVVIN